MKKLVGTIYQYFIFRKLKSPYFRTIFMFVWFIMFFTLILYAAFPIPEKWMPFSISKRESTNYFYTAIFLLILYIIFSFLFKRKKIKDYPYWENKVKLVGKQFVIYNIIIMVILIILGTLHVRNKW